MAAEKKGGQSVIEFVLMLPVMVAFMVLTIRVNMAIQMAIVNQQYARAATLDLAANSAVYPSYIGGLRNLLASKGFSQMLIGVTDDPRSDEVSSENPEPLASIQNIARNGGQAGDNSPKIIPQKRSLVRIRNTVTLCTQTNYVRTANGITPLINENGDYVLNESTRLELCGSQLPYE